MSNRKKTIVLTLLALMMLSLLLYKFGWMLERQWGFEICKLLGGEVKVTERMHNGSEECFIFGKIYSESYFSL